VIAQNNKIIAKFMGAKEGKGVGKRKALTGVPIPLYLDEKILTDKSTCFIDELRYHSDWNWLMEVVEKIESLNTSFSIDGNKCYCINDSFCNAQKEPTKIESVYKVCIAFINWYNEPQLKIGKRKFNKDN